ncbi:MAG: alpha/beta hydrolase [Thermostichus sp. BF3_bins_97]
MSLSSASTSPLEALYLGISPSLKLFDQPLLGSLGKCFRMAYWEYHQTQDEPCSLEMVITLLYDYLKVWDHPVHLIGHGLSGMVAYLFTCRYPQRVRSLTLLAVGGQPAATWHTHFYVQRQMLPCSREQLLARTALTLLVPSEHWRVRSLSCALAKDLDTSPVPHSLFQVMAVPTQKVLVPMLVCGSKDDPIVDPISLERWENNLKPGDQIWSCPGGRHFFHYFFPSLVSLKVLDFWQGLHRYQPNLA